MNQNNQLESKAFKYMCWGFLIGFIITLIISSSVTLTPITFLSNIAAYILPATSLPYIEHYGKKFFEIFNNLL